MKLEVGAVTDSGNFVLRKKIETLDELWEALLTSKSVFARHKMYPSAFIIGWSIRLVTKWIDNGWFWVATRKTDEDVTEVSPK